MRTLDDMPWAIWLEETIPKLIDDDVQRIMMVTINADGDIATGYSDGVSTNDLALGGFWLTQEAMAASLEDEGDEDEQEV